METSRELGLGLGAAAAAAAAETAAEIAGTERAVQAMALGQNMGAPSPPSPRKVDEGTGRGDNLGDDAEGAPNKRRPGSPGEGRMGRPGPKQQSRGASQCTYRKGHNGESHAAQTGI